jgi:TldD protein
MERRSASSMNRREFLKKGAQSGVLIVSLPLWEKLGCAATEDLGTGNEPPIDSISREKLRKLLAAALGRGGEFAEIYLEYSIENSISLDEDKIANATRGLDMGAGFRVLHGERTGYAFSDDLSFPRLREAAGTAALIASGMASVSPGKFKELHPPVYYQVKVHPGTIASKAKAELLLKANAVARSFDKRITDVRARFSDKTRRILIADSQGLYVKDAQTHTSLGVSVNAREGERRSVGYEDKSGSLGFEHFDRALAEDQARKASEMALRLLPAEDAPAGEHPIVIGPGYGGIFFHEAIGHSLEADAIRKKTSVFWDRRGRPIASPVVNLVDDGTWPGGWGTVAVDDEGFPGHKTTLIEKGVCSGFLQDRLNARLMKVGRTGNGRRESYQYYPIPRMTNTYLLPGDSPPEEIIRSVDNGVYVAKIGGGNVDSTTGRFVFSVDEAYMLEGGKKTRPLKGIMLMGSGLEVLKNITMVGNDLLVIGGGSCGKRGQSKPVGFGNPTLKVARITVGGKNA